MSFGVCQMRSLRKLGSTRFLAGSCQDYCRAGVLRCPLRCHPYALHVWHAGRESGILLGKFRNLAHTLTLTEGHSTLIWRKGFQGVSG